MSERHVVEANHVRQLRFLSGSPLEPDAVVLASDMFDMGDDLPNTDDTVTIAHGTTVIRGKVTDLVFLVEVDA